MAQNQAYSTALRTVEAADKPYDMLVAIHTLLTEKEKMRHNMVGRVSGKYTPEVLKKMVSEEIAQQIERTRALRDNELRHNDDLRSRGTPYSERVKMVNIRKIDWCDSEEKRLSALSHTFRVKPLEEWFSEVEYETAKSMGMAWVIRFWLEDIII